MKEQQAVLDFFSKEENLPLGLDVAEQMDTIRDQLNTKFWESLQQRLETMTNEYSLPWQVIVTEDKNTEDCLVGLYFILRSEQDLYLRPMMEQQDLGGKRRIYFGLMWSDTPSPDQLELPDITNLKESVLAAGFKSNENFLAWQWTKSYPRSKEFLLDFSRDPETLLNNTLSLMHALLTTHQSLIAAANAALKSAPRTIPVSLAQLRSKLPNK